MSTANQHILFIQPNLEGVGGIEQVIPVVARSLSQRGYVVSTFVSYGNIPNEKLWQEKLTLMEVESTSVFHKIYKTYVRLQYLVSYIKRISPDIIIVSAQGMAITVLLAKRLGLVKVSVLVYAHEGIEVSGKLYSFFIKRFYPTADGIIAVSAGIKKEIQTVLQIPEEKIILAYNALPIRNVDSALSVEDLEFQSPVFVTASRLEYIKGVDVLVDNFIQYAQTDKGTLVILGTGSLEQKLKLQVRDAGLENRIIFAGYQSDVEKYLQIATAYISCARREAFGLALLESIAVGTPVVATDVLHGPREIMNIPLEKTIKYPYTNTYGYLLSPPSIEKSDFYNQFKSALLSVQTERFDIAKLRSRAQFFTADNQIQGILKLIKSKNISS